MTNQAETQHVRASIVFSSIAIAITGIALTGCGDKKKNAPPPVAQVPSAPPPRELGPLEDLAMDPRVEFPEDRAPSTRAAAEAIAKIASAFATGNSDELSKWLGERDQNVLKGLVETGDWKNATADVEVVRVCVLDQNEDRIRLGLGVQSPENAILLAWEGLESDGAWRFQSIAIEPKFAMSARDLDGSLLVKPSLPGAEYDIITTPKEDEEEQTTTTTTEDAPARPGPGRFTP